MPSERRQLLFTAAEVIEAVRDSTRRLGKIFPAGAVQSSAAEGEKGGVIRFRITIALEHDARAKGPASHTQDIVTEGAALVAALILYCRDRRIPIAATSEKSLLRVGEQVCLLMTINAK